MRKVVRNTLASLAVVGFSGAAMEFTRPMEGLRTIAYRDSGGKPTICYGHTEGVTMGDEKTPEECERMLREELTTYVHYVDAQTHQYLPDEMRVAFADFTFNVGKRAFLNSSLLKYIRMGYYRNACDELPKWVWYRRDGKPYKAQGLIERRAAERELCLIGVDKMEKVE